VARTKQQRVDLLDLYPERAVDSELDGDSVVVLRPRFMSGPLARWLQPRLRRPHFRVHLDELGSFVWNRCDGRTTVGEIATEMEQHFGDQAEQAMQRLQRFLAELQRGKMIRLRGRI
jgi:hypothetical protein